MALRHKLKVSPANELKAEIVLRYGTIRAFAKAKGHKISTVYSALKFRRGGPISSAIRDSVTT